MMPILRSLDVIEVGGRSSGRGLDKQVNNLKGLSLVPFSACLIMFAHIL